MPQQQLEKLMTKILQQGDPKDLNTPNPVVSLEDFFEGNDDEGSIGCNLADHPGIDRFYDILMSIRNKKSVQNVLVRINEVLENERPFADVIYIITSSPIEEVQSWAEPLKPDEVNEGLYWDEKLAADMEIQPGMRIVHLWWD